MRRFTLFYTGDMHGRLTADGAQRIGAMKAAERSALLLDAGDAVRAGNLGVTPWGEAILDWMGAAGYDAMVAGNRETHLWRWAALAKLRRARFPVLCANVEGPGALAGHGDPVTPDALAHLAGDGVVYRRYVVVRLPDGLRVGILGLTVRMVTPAMAARHVSSYVFHDPVETARALVPALGRQADMVIALTHLGLDGDRRLAAAVPGIQLIVGGHSHDVLEQPEDMGGTVILHAGCKARLVGRAEVTLENRRVSVRTALIPLQEGRGGVTRRS